MSPSETAANLHRAERFLRSVVGDAMDHIDRLSRDPRPDAAALAAARRRYGRAAAEHAALLGQIDELRFEGGASLPTGVT